MEEPGEWMRWRLVMAEDCNVSVTEALAMDDITLSIANAALDKMIKIKNDAMKTKGKGR